ncbi:MAG: hypothetical protein HDQ96_00090 [Lachnospiraceae bacterium]|nr:hypothetical protein [Lachnospiraceae bacterium]
MTITEGDESYEAFADESAYEAYKEIPTGLKAGATVAVVVGLAVGALVVATGGTAVVLLVQKPG